MVENKMTNKEIADALELLTLSDAFAGNKMACNLFKMVSERLRDQHNQRLAKEIEYLQEELKKERDENAVLKAGLLSVRQLMNDSYGVDGLHENGEVAPWNELEQGGRFEEWLYAFNRAENT